MLQKDPYIIRRKEDLYERLGFITITFENSICSFVFMGSNVDSCVGNDARKKNCIFWV